jgi:hypothetical protein
VPHQYHKEEAFKLCDRIDASFPGMTRLVSLCHTESVKVTNPTKLFSVFIGLFHQGRSGPSIAVLRTRGTTMMIIAYLLVLFGVCWLAVVVMPRLGRYLRNRRLHRGVGDYLRQAAAKRR